MAKLRGDPRHILYLSLLVLIVHTCAISRKVQAARGPRHILCLSLLVLIVHTCESSCTASPYTNLGQPVYVIDTLAGANTLTVSHVLLLCLFVPRLPVVVSVECLPADKPWDVVSATRRGCGGAPRAYVRVYARVLVPPNRYIHTNIHIGRVDPILESILRYIRVPPDPPGLSLNLQYWYSQSQYRVKSKL